MSMRLLVIVAFNLKRAESDAYDAIRGELERHGLSENVSDEKGVTVKLPETTYLGVVDASSAKDLKESIASGLKAILKKEKIRATYVVAVAKDWTLKVSGST